MRNGVWKHAVPAAAVPEAVVAAQASVRCGPLHPQTAGRLAIGHPAGWDESTTG